MIVTIEDLWKIYPMGNVEVQALKGVNLEIVQGDFVSVAGPSGSGKTTLMNIIGLIDNFSRGRLTIDNYEIKSQNRRELARLRRDLLGFVFQSFNLLPVLNVFENVELPLIISGKGGSKAERRDRVNSLLEEVGLADRSRHIPTELSGGQQQRVAIARALVTKPKIVIADEPTANLDSATGEKVLSLMKEINHAEKTTFIFSTHDPHIWQMADHVVFLHDGLIESEQRNRGVSG
jgi:putative ABC transport system ATP-binding protein